MVETPSAEAALRPAQLIAAALIAGCVSFAAVVGVVVPMMSGSEGEPPSPPPAFGWIAWAGALAGFTASFAVCRVLRRVPAEADAGTRAQAGLRATIAALALNEGGALLAIALALAARQLVPFFYAAAVGFAGMILHFPTRARFTGGEPV